MTELIGALEQFLTVNESAKRVLCGKYEVVDELGLGGSADVFLVRHIELGGLFAMKILNSWTSLRDTSVERFRREASIVQKFNHPGTVQLRDFGKTDEGRYYLLTDYAEGDLLSDMIDDRGSLETGEALRIVENLLAVLGDAHDAGIIHRDVKPNNIIVDKGAIKLLDFGIASIFQQFENQKKITQDGTILGTPEFMAPELSVGSKALDGRSDLYSVGIVLYEALSGELPIIGSNMLQTLIMQATAAPKPLPAELKIPDFIQMILSKALQKDPERRYQNAVDFAADCRNARNLLDPTFERSQIRFVFEADAAPEPSNLKPHKEKNASVICLDDDPILLNLLSHVLSTEGYDVIALSDCAGIYQLLSSGKADLLICDEHMPGLSGTKVCKLLKKTLPEAKILLYSSILPATLQPMAAEAGVDAWVSKREPIAKLILTLRKLLAS